MRRSLFQRTAAPLLEQLPATVVPFLELRHVCQLQEPAQKDLHNQDLEVRSDLEENNLEEAEEEEGDGDEQ